MQNTVMLQSQALTQVALSRVSILNQMDEQFQEGGATTAQAMTVARGVEECCRQIVYSYSAIRKSVLLSFEILELKPAAPKPEAVRLWDAVDKGVTRLINSAIEMNKATQEFFGFFLRFMSSFQKYEANMDEDLVISLHHLKKDCRDFSGYQAEFMKTVDSLNDQAMRCIKNCVVEHIGAANFAAHQKQRKEAKVKYMTVLDKLEAERARYQFKYDDLQNEKIKLKEKQAKANAKQDSLVKSIEQKTSYLKQCEAMMKKMMDQRSKMEDAAISENKCKMEDTEKQDGVCSNLGE